MIYLVHIYGENINMFRFFDSFDDACTCVSVYNNDRDLKIDTYKCIKMID